MVLGVASFSDKVSSLYLSSALLTIMGLISAYTFSSIGQACKLHNVTTFSEAWYECVLVRMIKLIFINRRMSVSPKSASIISLIITFKTFFACLAYSIIIGKKHLSLFRCLTRCCISKVIRSLRFLHLLVQLEFLVVETQS